MALDAGDPWTLFEFSGIWLGHEFLVPRLYYLSLYLIGSDFFVSSREKKADVKILWISPRWPLPDDTGARKATMTLLKELVPAGKKIFDDFELDLVCLYDDPPAAEIQQSLS